MSSFTAFSNKMLSLILAFIFLPLSALTYGVDALSSGKRTDENRTNVAGIGAYFRSQGITSDGEGFFFSCKTSLIHTGDDSRTLINYNLTAIPDEIGSKYGIKHIGGISYYNGKIYAGLEDSKVWKYPVVGVYSAETLQLEEYYLMNPDMITRGLPWVAVDSSTGLLYCADHSKTPEVLFAFDTSNEMKLVNTVTLSESVSSIQGAEFRNGILYAATNDETQAIYKIDINSGAVSKYLDRNLTKGSEGEGMTFIEKNGKTVLTAIDMGPLFVNAFVREYPFN